MKRPTLWWLLVPGVLSGLALLGFEWPLALLLLVGGMLVVPLVLLIVVLYCALDRPGQ